jgi:glucans biosynthesis protein
MAPLFLALGVILLLLPHPSLAGTKEEPFSLENVVKKARELAEEPFQDPGNQVPDFLLKMDYDQWRDIRFRPEKALWKTENLPFQAQYFHPGFLYNRTVKINVIETGRIERIPFSPDLFHYGLNDFKDRIPSDLGFAGFRLHYPIHTRDYYDEVAVFLGASYFRAVGKGQRFGLSARALAIDTALDSGEEFPFFKEFWLQRPSGNAGQMVVYALLDSPSATGAYRFVIRPGEATIVEVAGTVFLRKEVGKLGIAPLTSMFFYGENTNLRPADDFRPEVHDSDGLLIATGAGERIWRPLVNPAALLDTSFQLNDLKGFGLCQRDRNFDHYQDLEAESQMRPTVWITPGEGWGQGNVELVQIPVQDETHDNIVSFWAPAKLPEPLQPISFSYKMRWLSDGPRTPRGYVDATRTARGKDEEARRFLIDFIGEELETLAEDAGIEAMISVGGGKVTEHHLQKNAFTGGWRLVFEVLPEKTGPLDQMLPDKMKSPLELRALLRQGEKILTETWSYVVFP